MTPAAHTYFAHLSLGASLLSVAPFAILLLAIAVLPLVPATEPWWEHNRNRLLVALPCSLAGALLYVVPTGDGGQLLHALVEYLAFLALVGSLYTISGGIHIQGAFAGFPWINTLFLAVGAVLANVLGTTGASMLLIRPFLRANHHRKHVVHQVVFFIFIVSNCGGLLTPLGDPPLFLGFLRGVPFGWTLRLAAPWAVTVGLLLGVFHILDERAYLREELGARENLAAVVAASARRLHIQGGLNFLWLGLVLLATLLAGYGLKPWLSLRFGEEQAGLLVALLQALILGALALVSYRTTALNLHRANHFSFGPVKEVAILFLGIFGAMLPALALLGAKGASLGLIHPWQYFWATGGLSGFLDNAPTYLSMGTLAATTRGLDPAHLGELAARAPRLLEAISCGAVFMGANTYIGNGPNFMVKAIASHRGLHGPGFFGYMLWSLAVLGPIFLLLTLLFFRG